MFQVDFNNPITVHFMGIGGISMSGLAEILIKRGFKVVGSDNNHNAQTDHLESIGAKISYPQTAANITDDIDLIVYTAAISEDNPEMVAARASKKPILTRAEFLGQVMANYPESIAVSGTHGKTSTTSMISQILLDQDCDPTISVGGILQAIGSNIRVGASDTFITEACEYTNSYHHFFPKYSLILNVEADHLDFFKDLDDVRASFKKFARNTSDDGALIINGAITDASYIYEGLPCQVITFGLEESNDCYGKDLHFDEKGNAVFTPVFFGETYEPIHMAVPGSHNVENALAAIALSLHMRIPFSNIKKGLEAFKGADRRFEYKGTLNGFTIVDDYAHHPTEISACLSAAANYPHNKLVVVFQSHTYTRTKAFLDEFAQALSVADLVIIAKIYAAREDDIYGVSGLDIQQRIQALGTEAYYFETFEEIEKFILKKCTNSDLLITMGAGDVVKVGEDLLK